MEARPLQPKPDNFRSGHNGEARCGCQCAKWTMYPTWFRGLRLAVAGGFEGAWNALAGPALDMRMIVLRALFAPSITATGGP
jgi:hypothetical protein